jgi:hypothetical protein
MGFERAWNVLLAIDSPFGRESTHQVLGFLLSALGYLLVPAVIGLAVADAIVRFTRRRLVTHGEAVTEIGRLVAEDIEKRVKH